ncbi:nuclear factor 7, ovary-like [Protopterus annectens]|uniref:nuclear factor 7, ovary-like n=1 Tax=Protopterus annectens TaxID=7888 RepID=UPI001CFBCD48|nr:nuclear factor 7, ovary-like [Protopterus annectens]
MAACKPDAADLEECICSICLELFNVPVMLDCGHNFCRSCIDKVWDSTKQPSCPECRELYPDKKYAVNRLLANVIQKVQVQMQEQIAEITGPEHKAVMLELKLKANLLELVGRGEAAVSENKAESYPEPNSDGPDPWQKYTEQRCVEHGEMMKLFCEQDEILACLFCVPEHRGHNFLTLWKAIKMYKDKLTMSLSHLQSNLKYYQGIKCLHENKLSDVTADSKHFQLHIAEEFDKLHQFLREKEEKLVQQLKKEEDEVLKQSQENLKKVQEAINAIQQSISDIHLLLQQQDTLTFLKEIKPVTKRLKKCEQRCEKQSIEVHSLSQGVYKGPLQYATWKEMKSILNPGSGEPITCVNTPKEMDLL